MTSYEINSDRSSIFDLAISIKASVDKESAWYTSCLKIPFIPLIRPNSIAIFCVKITGIPGTKGRNPGKCSVLLSDNSNNFVKHELKGIVEV